MPTRLRSILWFLVAAFLAAAVGVSYVALSAQPSYAVYIDGALTTVQGRFDTVSDVLRAVEVEVDAADMVLPPPNAAPDIDRAIALRRASTVVVKVDAREARYETQQTTLGGFLNETGIRLRRTDEIVADSKPIPFHQVDEKPLPALLEIRRTRTVTIVDDDRQTTLRTSAETVGGALVDAGITLYASDGVQPPQGAWLTGGTTIVVSRARPYTLLVDGQTRTTRSYHTNSYDVLAEAGFALVGFDYARPGPEHVLQPGDTIELVRVTESYELTDSPIPFETLWQPTDELEIDQTALLTAGREGVYRERTRIRYENGVETARTPDGAWIAEPAVDEVIGYGTRIVVRTVDTPDGPIEYWRVVEMRVTGYTAASSGKAPDHPYYGITASGVPAGYGVVAIDPAVVPFRSDVYVPGYGVAFAGDTGGGVKGRWIDLGFDEDNYESWHGTVMVYYLTPVPPASEINFRIPSWLP